MKWIKRIFLGGIIFLVILMTVGWLSQAVFSRYEVRKYSLPGQLVDVGGHKLHLQCSGAGSPTVILDTGLGLPAASFGPLQREFAKTTRVWSAEWFRLQHNLANFSTNSKFIVAEHGGHHIPFEQPDIVVAAAVQMIQELREKQVL